MRLMQKILTTSKLMAAAAIAFSVAVGLLAAQTARTHITTGGTLPTNCTVGDFWMKTGTSAGPYWCSATDTWTADGGAGGTVTISGSPANGNLAKFTSSTAISNVDLSGDVTTSGTAATTIASNAVTTTKINNAAVTLAKIQNASASSKLLGSGASGSGSAYTELSLGAGVSMSGTTLSGKIAQVVVTELTSVATGTTIIPADNTIPQITEGTEFMTATITPTSASSTLVIAVTCQLAAHTATRFLIAALFQDSTANALAASLYWQQVVDGSGVVTFTHAMTSGTTSATTFKVRAGTDQAATITINGGNGTRFFGGVMASSIVVTEVLP